MLALQFYTYYNIDPIMLKLFMQRNCFMLIGCAYLTYFFMTSSTLISVE